MSRRSLALDDKVYDYLLAHSADETDAMRRLRAETAPMRNAGMQISPEQGQLLGFLVTLIGARNALEIGTFTGYSSLAVARHLPPGGKLVACDVSDEFTQVARRYWADAGLADRVELRLGPALDSLAALAAEGWTSKFDFAFIDADKPSYDGYYERCLTLVRPGGLIAIDNVLWSGAVADPADQSESTVALRRLNAKIRDDDRVDHSMLPIGDGLMLVRRR